jgi:hypothetical protein
LQLHGLIAATLPAQNKDIKTNALIFINFTYLQLIVIELASSLPTFDLINPLDATQALKAPQEGSVLLDA